MTITSYDVTTDAENLPVETTPLQGSSIPMSPCSNKTFKYTYTQNAQSGSNAVRKDDSFKSCVCTLLVFLAICILLFLLAALIKEREPDIEVTHDNVLAEKNFERYQKAPTISSSTPKTVTKIFEQFEEISPVNDEYTSTTRRKNMNFKQAPPEYHTKTTDDSTDNFSTTPGLKTTTDVLTTNTPTRLINITFLPWVTTSYYETGVVTTPEDNYETSKVIQSDNYNSPDTSTNDYSTVTSDDATDQTENFTDATEIFSSTTDAVTEPMSLKLYKASTKDSNEVSIEYETEPVIEVTTDVITEQTTSPSTPKQIFSTFKELTSTATDTPMLTCDAPQCRKSASEIYSKLNTTAEPCRNFYEFACGGSRVDERQAKIDRNSNIIKQMMFKPTTEPGVKIMQDFYQHCVVYDPFTTNLKELLEMVETKIDKFVNKSESLKNDKKHLSSLIAELMLRHDSSSLFDINLDIDKNDVFVLKITPPKLAAANPQSILNCQVDAKRQLSEPVIDLYEIYENYDSCIKNSIDVDSIHKVETVLTSALKDNGRDIDYEDIITDFKLIYNNCFKHIPNLQPMEEISIAGLDEIYPVIDWTDLFEQITEQKLPKTTPVIMYAPFFFHRILFPQLRQFDERKIHNLLLGVYLTDLYIELSCTKLKPREEYCLDKTIDYYTPVISNQFLKDLPQVPQLKLEIIHIYKKLRSAFTALLNKTPQLEDDNRKWILDELKGLKLYLFESNYNWGSCNGHARCVDPKEEVLDSFLDYWLFSTQSFRERRLNAWNQPCRQHSCFQQKAVFETEVGLVYPFNVVAVPYGAFSEVSHLEDPTYINLHKVGFQLAHHMAKHFSAFEDSRNLTSSFKDYFQVNITTCGKKQYEGIQKLPGYNDINVSYRITGNMMPNVISRKMADDAAIQLLYELVFGDEFYKKFEKLPWIEGLYDEKQLLFITAVQNFCKSPLQQIDLFQTMKQLYDNNLPFPEQVRVTSFLKNDPRFEKVFNCPIVPDKCAQFPYFTGYHPVSDNAPYSPDAS